MHADPNLTVACTCTRIHASTPIGTAAAIVPKELALTASRQLALSRVELSGLITERVRLTIYNTDGPLGPENARGRCWNHPISWSALRVFRGFVA
jgi:hypothetical protein